MMMLVMCLIFSLAIKIDTSQGLENSNLVEYRSTNHSNRASPYGCYRVGLGCDNNCRDVVMCSLSNSGTYVQEYVGTCKQGKICVEGQCAVPPKNPVCDPYDGLKFECYSIGVFPDPGNCKYYHMCAREDPYNEGKDIIDTRIACEGPRGQYGFNPKSGNCDKKLTNSVCPSYPIPLCKTQYASAPLSENPTYYYTCDVHAGNGASKGWLYPKQKRCENGKKFSATSGCPPS